MAVCFTVAQLRAMKVTGLRKLCRKHKLAVGGKKADLVLRLSSTSDSPFKIKKRGGFGVILRAEK